MKNIHPCQNDMDLVDPDPNLWVLTESILRSKTFVPSCTYTEFITQFGLLYDDVLIKVKCNFRRVVNF